MQLMRIMRSHWKTFLVFVLVIEALGNISAFMAAKIHNMIFIQAITPVFLAPPVWFFSLIWVIMYALLGFAAFCVVYTCKDRKRQSLGLFFCALQVILIVVWQFVFWGFGIYWLGVFIAIALNVVTLYMIWHCWRCRGVAGLAMAMCFIWFLITAYLSIGVAIFNE